MKTELIKQVIIDQQALPTLSPWVNREIDIHVLTQNQQVGVIAGVRRCGKSVLLQHIRRQSKEQSYYINFDDDRLIEFSVDHFQMLLETFIELYGEQHTFYFDEIQNILGWERFVRRLHDNGEKVYVTGSNATLFSQELGTRLTGRYNQITLYPFSYPEFLAFYDQKMPVFNTLTSTAKAKLKKYFNQFELLGGVPEYLRYQQKDYLHFLYESIIYRDIVARYKIQNPRVLKELVYFLASNTGKEVSYNALRKALGVASASTISDYCSYLENSFLCFFINRFDYSLKKQLHTTKKVYFIDQALAHVVGFRNSEDKGRILENIVFLELKRRGYEIYFYKGQKECDFLLRQQNHIIAAIQVCTNLQAEKTRERELAGLAEALSIHQLKSGLILTENTFASEILTIQHKKIRVEIMPVWYWALFFIFPR